MAHYVGLNTFILWNWNLLLKLTFRDKIVHCSPSSQASHKLQRGFCNQATKVSESVTKVWRSSWAHTPGRAKLRLQGRKWMLHYEIVLLKDLPFQNILQADTRSRSWQICSQVPLWIIQLSYIPKIFYDQYSLINAESGKQAQTSKNPTEQACLVFLDQDTCSLKKKKKKRTSLLTCAVKRLLRWMEYLLPWTLSQFYK